jgi:hypothetical protein
MAIHNFFEHLPSGEIIKVGLSQNPTLQMADDPDGTMVVLAESVSADMTTKYVVSGSLTNRPTNNATIDKTTITADGTDEAIITNITDQSTVSVTSINTDPISDICEDGQVEFATLAPGEYTITITPEFPEQTKIFTVVAE